jgi:hypothetical protein
MKECGNVNARMRKCKNSEGENEKRQNFSLLLEEKGWG